MPTVTRNRRSLITERALRQIFGPLIIGGWKGCHDFKSSAVSTMKPKWIEDDFNAHATGINVSLKGAGASFNGADASAKIKNNRGQKGAYISGRVCAGITAISIRFTSTAKAFAYGNIRTVNASV